MQSNEIRRRFLDFFEKRGHSIIPSASLVPQDDPSVLFTTAGMQPLVPYLLGEKHPQGKRLVSVQKCVRTQDIEEVGDKIHDTFFEMLGNWSLGDYFKKEAISWSYEFLTSEKEGLGLDPKKLYITVFAGNENAPRDEESFEIWKSVGVPENRIYFLKENWWSPGKNGPCGPDTEMFYDITKNGLGDLSHEEFIEADKNQDVVEIWNDVFMEYEKKDGKIVGKLSQKNVDTGAGLERIAMVMQGVDNIFETDLFIDLMSEINKISTEGDIKLKRIIADHIRTAVLIISDGVVPSNTDRGYILRRLIRRAVRYADKLVFNSGDLVHLIDAVILKYKDIYKNVNEKKQIIQLEINKEEKRFRKTLERGLKELSINVSGTISAKEAFDLYQTYGFPIEMTQEIAEEKGINVDVVGFKKEFEKHQKISKAGVEKRFKGGLAGHGEMETKYHTATHLLHKALQTILGENALQKGSNITSERLRFDFTHPQKMTDQEKKDVEDLVNQKINEGLPVLCEEMTLEDAKKIGATGLFEANYSEKVTVYKIGDDKTGIFSLEICGGPHVTNTSELGHLRIKKEESVSAGIRRIKAVLE